MVPVVCRGHGRGFPFPPCCGHPGEVPSAPSSSSSWGMSPPSHWDGDWSLPSNGHGGEVPSTPSSSSQGILPPSHWDRDWSLPSNGHCRGAFSPLFLIVMGNVTPSHRDGDWSLPSNGHSGEMPSAPSSSSRGILPLSPWDRDWSLPSNGLGGEMPSAPSSSSSWGASPCHTGIESDPFPAFWRDLPALGTSGLCPAPAWAPPGQRGSAWGGSPQDNVRDKSRNPRTQFPPQGTWLPVLSPARGWEGGARTPPAVPAAALAVCPVLNNCGAKYSPAGGRCPSEDTCAKPSPSRGSLPPGPTSVVAWVPAGTSVPPLAPHWGGLRSPPPGSVAQEKGEVPPRGWLCPFPLPCPKTGPIPGSWAWGGCGRTPSLPAGGAAWEARPDPVSGGNFSQGWRRAEGHAGPTRGWHPSGLLPVPPPRLPWPGHQINAFLFFWQEEENGNRAGPPRSRLEPMDTIFVKNVREDGPAHQAGLRTGDRLVKVNGESIIGKTYSQVIALIQNSDDVLELSIMPKDEDILQLAYSQDAYLKGNEPYSGGAQSIPEPPPICYPRKTYPFQARGSEPPPGPPPDTRAPRPTAVGPASPLGTATLASTRSEAGGSPAHRPDEPQPGGPPLRPPAPHGHPGSFSRTGCPSNVASSLPDRYGVSPAASSCYGVPKHLPEHRTHCGFKEGVGGLPVAGRPPREGNQRVPGRQECQQALSRWFCSQEPRRSSSEERRHAMPPRYRSVSQDRLGGSAVAPRGWPHSASHDTLLQPPREGWAPRARSDHYLGRYGRSMEALEPSALLSPRLDRSGWPPERVCRATVTAAGQPIPHSSFVPSSSSSSSSSREPVQKHPSQPNLQSVDDSGYIGYRSYSPSFQRRTGLLHALSFRDPAFGGLPTFSISQRPAAPLPERVVAAVPPPTGPQPVPTAPRDQRPEGSRVPEQPEERREEVVLRQKPPTGRKMPPPMRQMNFVFPEGVKETDICDPPLASGKGERPVAERQGRRVAPLAAPEDSLASIPFIDEPTSPSIDLKAKHVPASSVVSSAMNSAPAVATSPSSPTFAFALSRHYSQDCSSIKAGRRSSYLLAITTERSKSCDDGLNAFRDEGKILRRMPSRVPSLRMLRSFFTDGSLDSLGTSEDARSKRHSTSDLSDVPFSAVRKEGWLHCKQILTKKGKKVGGGIRQWKRVFAVLRTHSLYLCKDRREAVTCAPAPGEEEPPISIRACLVDISYSETKRKHVFRLTTADFCEYLFQAEDREDMLAWIKVIRENSKAEGEDPGFASQALINKKLNDYRKVSPAGAKPDSSPKGSRGLGIRAEFLKQTGTSAPRSPRQDTAVTKDESSSQKAPWGINIMKKNKKSAPRAFGVRLEDCQPAPDNKNVPLIVEACCKVVEDRGLEYMGIYRVPGNNAVVSSLQEQLNKGATEINLQDERWQDLNVISSLLKSFFRKLPEPLFTDDKYNDFIEANRIEDASERMRTLRKLIRDLPGHYYETLKFLVGHLKTIADHSEKNKMEPRNLALVFGPTLVRTSEDNMTDMVTHMPDRYKIVETLIQHSDWFFSDKEDKGEKTPVDEKEAQSVPNIEYLLPNIGRTAAPGDAAGEEQCPWHSPPPSSHPGTRAPLGAPPAAPSPLVTPLPTAGPPRGRGRPLCARAGCPGTPLTIKWGHPPLGGASRALSPPSPVTLLSGGHSSSLCDPGWPRGTPARAHCPPRQPHAANPETGRL
uniref:Rho GTPase activating protein 23 n=1 Tax=Calidris pygmaea TaxID=425635 RepID=A0A8C3PN19_9CHAR